MITKNLLVLSNQNNMKGGVNTIAKKKHEVKVEIIGGNAEGVTGSCTRIKTSEHCYLFECGMIQGKHTVLENYHANMKYIQKNKATGSRIHYYWTPSCRSYRNDTDIICSWKM